MRGSRAISSLSVALMAATIVSGLPCGCGSVANAATWDRRRREDKRRRRVEAPAPARAAPRRPPALTSRSTDARIVREVLVGGQSLARQELAHAHQRIAPCFRLAFGRRLVEPLVVGERVRVRPNHRGVHERRTLPFAHVGDRLAQRPVAGQIVGAVAAEHAEAREAFDQRARCRRPASALRPAPRSRSRCLRRETAPAACACRPCSAIPRTRPRWCRRRRSRRR